MTDYIKNLIKERPAEDKYMLLSRMQFDCNYYLGAGGRYAGCLWSENEAEHIENMKALWESFPEDAKPEWLPWEKIEEFEREML